LSIIDDVFTPLYGKPCWSVRSNLGSMLDFEFGDPHLIIRGPTTPRSSASARVRQDLARREIKVRGAWHLWIEFCGWRYYQNDKEIGTSISSKRVINRIITEVDGQSLVNVMVEEDGATAFNFDLGGLLETYPVIDPDGDQDTMDSWTLFEPNGYFFTLRKDIKYCHKLDNFLTTEEDYKLLFPKLA
jgi:hypothetical protein